MFLDQPCCRLSAIPIAAENNYQLASVTAKNEFVERRGVAIFDENVDMYLLAVAYLGEFAFYWISISSTMRRRSDGEMMMGTCSGDVLVSDTCLVSAPKSVRGFVGRLKVSSSGRGIPVGRAKAHCRSR